MADATRRVSVRLSLDDAARVKAGLREVGETGQRSLDQIKGGAERASRSLELLDIATRGIQIAGVAVAARALVQAGDALTQGLSRLQNATGSVERAGQVYEALYRNALQTGVAVSESVDAFQRFSIAAREIGATSDQVVRLVGGLQRVAIVSGASTQEISSATLQLAQALASGVLQGDELRSILEAMPLLAEGLARELGVSIGELRKLGSEGKLTAERVFPALLRATERLGAELDRAPLSLGRAFGQLTAATENFLGQLDRAIGLSNALARALSAAARAVDSVRQGAGLRSEEERLAGLRRQAEALSAQIGRLESEGDGRDSLRAPVRRGSIRPGLVGTAEQQAGVDTRARLEELRRDYFATLAEIDTAERESLNRRIEEQERAGQAAADARRRRATQDVQELTRDLDDRFEDAIVRGDKLSKVMQGLLQDITRIIARRTITEPLGNAVSAGLTSLGAGSWFDGIGSWLGGLFRAEGGPVAAGQPYIVGERGPEWFVPDRGGTVLPSGMAPGGPVIQQTINIDARGADAGVEARLRLLAGQIARQASAMTLDAIRRGGSAYETVRGCAGLHALPRPAPGQAAQHQSHRASQRRDQAPHRRRRHLSQRGRRRPPRRRHSPRAVRRMGHPARPLHDPGNHRRRQQHSPRQPVRRDRLTRRPNPPRIIAPTPRVGTRPHHTNASSLTSEATASLEVTGPPER
jgi:tape measure domain-containing protein